MNRIIPATIAILLSLTLFDCKHNPVVSPPAKTLRNLTWKVDTVAYAGSNQTALGSICGTSVNEVYVLGFNSNPGPGTMFRWTGSGWITTRFHQAEGGPVSGAVSFNAGMGFGPNNTYFVGGKYFNNSTPPPNFLDSSLVIRFDGTFWHELAMPRSRSLSTIFGIAANDIWVGGLDGTLFHFDGVTWSRDSVPMYIPPNADPYYDFRSITGRSSAGVYLLLIARESGQADRDFLFRREAGSWVLIDSTNVVTRIWMSPSGRLYGIGLGMYEWKGPGNWNLVFNPYAYSIWNIFGLSDDNIFVVGFNGSKAGLFHYNGSDWYEFKNQELPNVAFSAVWTDGSEVFVTGLSMTYPMVSVVLHGK